MSIYSSKHETNADNNEYSQPHIDNNHASIKMINLKTNERNRSLKQKFTAKKVLIGLFLNGLYESENAWSWQDSDNWWNGQDSTENGRHPLQVKRYSI